jgi:hypothetical protein
MSNLNYRFLRRPAVAILLATFCVLTFGSDAQAQRRDFMTEAEIEIVRDAQDIDQRIDVLTKMIDRRFAALKVDAGGWKPPSKETEKWGEEPAGTRLQLLTDVRRLLQKAVDDIDDVAEHDTNAQTQNKTTGKLFPKAVRGLAAAVGRYSPILQATLKSTTDEKERGAILDSIDLSDQILAAATKLPAEQKKTKN